MPAPIQPFNLSELEEVAALDTSVTQYIVYSDAVDYFEVETITTSREAAFKALQGYKSRNVPVLHLHQVVGKTKHPIDEEKPIIERCLNHACYGAVAV